MKKRQLFFLISMFAAAVLHAQVLKTIQVNTAGDLGSLLTANEKNDITDLTVTGIVDARDFATINNMPSLLHVDLSGTTVAAFGTAPANAIPSDIFNLSSEMETFVFPGQVSTISAQAFRYCTRLSSLTIPSSVTSIGDLAFATCTSLSSIHVGSSVPVSLNGNEFEGVSKSICVLYVPKGTVNLYKAAIGWKDFTYIGEEGTVINPFQCNGIDRASLRASVSNDTLCAGEKAKVSFTATKLPNADANKIKYEWSYMADNKAITLLPSKGYLGTYSSALAFDVFAAGYYIVRLHDDSDPTNDQCIYADTVRIDTASVPRYNFSEGQTLCQGDAFQPIDVNITAGYGPWNITLDGIMHTVGALGDKSGKFTFTPDIKRAGTTYYSLTAISDKYCVGNTIGGDTAKVVVNILPTSVFSDLAPVCSGSADLDITANLKIYGANPVRSKFYDNYRNLSASGVFHVPTVAVKTAYELCVYYEDANGCKYGDTTHIVVNPSPVVTFDLQDRYCGEESINYAAAAYPSGGVFSVSPILPLSGGSVEAQLLNHKTDYTFSYLYTDENGCDTLVTDVTYAISVPAITVSSDFTITGIKPGLPVIADISVQRPGAEYVINWIDPNGNPMTGPSFYNQERITVPHVVTSAATTFVYKAYLSLEGCVGEMKDVNIIFEPCAALPPIVSDAYFCADESGKQITASLDPTRQNDLIGWIDGSEGSNGFNAITSYTDPKVTGSATKNITVSGAGEYTYYVAARDEVNMCWSYPKKVTVYIKDNPIAKIAPQARVACYNSTRPLSVEVTPDFNAQGITSIFTVDGVATAVPQYLPATKTTGGTLYLTYAVDAMITPAGYNHMKTCKSNTATAEYMVEYVAPPIVNSITAQLDRIPYPALTASIDNSNNTINWYTSAVAPRTVAAHGTSYDPSNGMQFNTDSKITIYATQVTPNGCESRDEEGILHLVSCKHLAPVADGFMDCANALDGTEALTLSSKTPMQSSGAVYTWYDGTSVLGRGKTFVPVNLTPGKHTVQVGVADWVDPILLPGQICYSPKSDVIYEVFESPTPTISGVVADLSVADNAIVLKGQNKGGDLHPNGIGVFNFSSRPTEIGGSCLFSPETVKEGVHTVSFTYTNENGCTATSQDYTITVHSADDKPYLSAMTTELCAGETVSLVAHVSGSAAPYTYRWSAGTAQNEKCSVAPASTGYCYVTVTDANNNRFVDSVLLTVHQSLFKVSASPETVKLGESSELSASGGVSYIWSNNAKTASQVVRPDMTTEYSVSITDEYGCSAIVSTKVSVTGAVAEDVLQLSLQDVQFGAVGDSVAVIEVTATSLWTAYSDQPWASVIRKNDANSFEIVVEENKTLVSRTATVTVEIENKKQMVTIVQSAGKPYIAVSNDTVTVSNTAGSFAHISVTSNTIWIAGADQEWIIVDPSTQVTGAHDMTMTVSGNIGLKRSATISLVGTDVLQTIIVIQDGTSTGVESSASTDAVIYPNPTSNSFSLLNGADVETVEVYNVYGDLVLRTVVSSDKDVSVANLSKGIYSVKLCSANSVVIEQLIVE